MISIDDPSPRPLHACGASTGIIVQETEKGKTYKKAAFVRLLGTLCVSLCVIGLGTHARAQSEETTEQNPEHQENAASQEQLCTGSSELRASLEDNAVDQLALSSRPLCPGEEELTIPTQEEIEKEAFAKELESMTKGYPIEEMAPYIAEHDRTIAGFIVGIAMKESQWGRRSPSLNGVTCYNYWGIKGSGSRGVGMGFACFGSPEEAVDRASEMLEKFVYTQGLDTPAKLVTPWKCGRSCQTHNPESVSKWIADVNRYYDPIVNKENEDLLAEVE
jgi:hypothetical protein